MDFSESTKAVYDRIQKLEPENVSKIVGYLLLQDHGEREMIRLAFSPDNLIQSLINKAKADLGLSSKSGVPAQVSPIQVKQTSVSELPLRYTPFLQSSSRSFSSPVTIQAPNSFWEPQVTPELLPVHNLGLVPPPYTELIANQLQFLSLEEQLEPVNSVGSDKSGNYFFTEAALGQRTSRMSPSLPEFPVKICYYFSKGFCKHGSNCRYFHGHSMPESLSHFINKTSSDFANDDHVLSPGSLEKLEMELTELLQSRRGLPVSIASLPMLYYEKYGKTLQAEGYLTESQRHGKAGYSLTKLLARLKNSICLIDRPHGQHSVILAEDIPKYMDYNGERIEHGGIVAGSRQIYLTFPAESTFTEHDVSHYFHKYGPVQDVRIPCQQKRMFGFVTFVFAETVKQILAKGNPHFVCGARVLVKPYREKSKHVDRRYPEKLRHPVHYNLHFMDSEFDFSSMPTLCDNSWSFRKRLMEEHEQAIELESGHLSELQLAAKTLNNHSYLGFPMNEQKHLEAHAGQKEPPSTEQFTYILDVLNGASTSEEEVGRINTSYSDQESTQALPDSPFASPMASSIPTVI